jgi:GNAT superfamily N-acetyltransferase
MKSDVRGSVTIRSFVTNDRVQAARLFEDFQDYLIAMDPLDRLCRLPGYGESYVAKTVAETMQEGIFNVAEIDGSLIGLVAGYVKRQKPEDLTGHVPSVVGWVTELYVSPEVRGGGVGVMLLEAAEDSFRGSGCDVSRLAVFAPNFLARHFYDRQGYGERDVELIKGL